jgi:hypothetical protein
MKKTKDDIIKEAYNDRAGFGIAMTTYHQIKALDERRGKK